MNSLLVVTACVIPFVLFVIGPPWFDPLFLIGYVSALLGLMMLPLLKRRISLKETETLYRGLIGAVGVGIMISILLSAPWGILDSGTLRYAAAFWIFLSLLAPLASAFNVSRLGNLLRQEGPDPLQLQTRARLSVQHFSLEYSTLQWLNHARYSLISFAGLAASLYGWALFGVPFLAFSIGLLLVTILALLRLPKKLLSPKSPNEVLTRIHDLLSRDMQSKREFSRP